MYFYHHYGIILEEMDLEVCPNILFSYFVCTYIQGLP